jgi:hypothetical protein
MPTVHIRIWAAQEPGHKLLSTKLRYLEPVTTRGFVNISDCARATGYHRSTAHLHLLTGRIKIKYTLRPFRIILIMAS